jgi:Tol biopolymer transport system component
VPLELGSRLGAYEIVSPLGAGGMGEVYRARDVRLDRFVAVKVLPSHLARDPAALARFEREARAVAALSHPNVLAIHDFGEHDGVAYAVMELLEGRTLRERLAAGPLPLAATIDYATQIADGLAAAHDKSLVHRDLKPGNVFVTTEGRVKILDFGLAKPSSAPHPGADANPTASLLTEPGTVVGTMGYTAPEQLKALAVDHRADLFSFGALLWEMLTGRRAFERPTPVETMAAILREDPPALTSLAPHVPIDLARIAHRCLEKDPSRRFQSAHDLSFALRGVAARPGESSPSASAMRAAAGPTRSVLPLPDGVRLSGEAAPVLTIARDGRTVAYVGLGSDDVPRLYAGHLDTGETDVIPNSDYAEGPFFSPDGRAVAFAADIAARSARSGELRKYSFASRLTQAICPLPGYEGGCWSDEDAIYFVGDVLRGLQRVSAAGGVPEPAVRNFRIGATTAPRCIGWPRLLDARSALVIDWDASALGDTSLLDLVTGELRALASSGSAGTPTPIGHVLFTQPDGLMLAAPLDRTTGKFARPATAVAKGLALDSAGGAFALSETGTLVYAQGELRGSVLESKRLVRLRSSGAPTVLPFPPSPIQPPVDLSRSGRQLLLSTRTLGLWIYDVERGTRRRLPPGATRLARYAVWSPTEDQVVFRAASLGEMGWKVFAQRADGSEDPRILSEQDALEKRPRGFSPDGETLYWDVGAGDRKGLWALGMHSDTEPQRLHAGAFDDASISPDGTAVAYQSGEFGSVEIFIRQIGDRSRPLQVSIDGGRSPRWSPDGRELFYFSGERLIAVPIAPTADGPALGTPRVVLERADIEAYAVGLDRSVLTLERFPNSGIVRQLQLVTGWLEELARLAPAQ